MTKNVAIASDGAGLELKKFLIDSGGEFSTFHFMDLGPDGGGPVDYPDYAKKVVEKILGKEADFGVLICGTGVGMSIAANRFRGIRAGLCHHSLEARLVREHNDANILCLGARMIGKECALENLRVFLATPFGGGRHLERIRKLDS
ncbi:MAG: ribose 5-phosphate isomerase B [Rickettsiales bacterium]|jgi:ribose 5-phosphate isomerase B|nr:ribose 5-phosphate isomerase B [Rickettsiales bacterium]